jgi:hypothetical protein
MTRNAPRRRSDQHEAAAYIADMTLELTRIAQSHGLGTLGYLLDMARMEAARAAEANEGGGS